MPDPHVLGLAEMTGVNGDGGTHPYSPREGEERLWRWVDTLAMEAERVRREEAQFDRFQSWIDLFYGKHWPSTLPSFRPPVVANELHTLILSEASDLTASKLRIYVTKRVSAGLSKDEEAERALRAIWKRQQVDLKLLLACVWGLVVGTGFLGVGWDPDEHHGFGDVTVDDVDPRTVLPDPDAVDDKKWLYAIREQAMDLQEIRRLFPIHGWRVRPEDRWSMKDTRQAPTGMASASYLGPMAANDTFVGGLVPGYKKARARVLDCMIRDDATEETVEEARGPDGRTLTDESGAPILQARVTPKYPNGRRIVAANGVILFDGNAPPCARWGPHPDFGLLRVVLEPLPGRFWGMGWPQKTGELNLAADKLLSNVVENSVRLNNGVVISTTNTGLDWESFAGIPAQIVQINPGSEFKIVYPPAMPPDMVQAPWRMLDLQRRILGFPDARMGEATHGNVSPELTETEIAQAQGPTRLRATMLYHMVQRLAEMIFARMAHGYTTERMIPAVEGEQWKPVVWKPLDDPDKYSVYVDPASVEVMSLTMLRRLSVALYRFGAIDRTALLETIGWPSWEATAKRVDQAAAQAAWAKERAKRGSR